MHKVMNIKFSNQRVGVSVEMVDFDENGIGSIKSEKIYHDVLQLPGFFAVEQDDADKAAAKAKEEEEAKKAKEAEEEAAKAKEAEEEAKKAEEAERAEAAKKAAAEARAKKAAEKK